MFPDALSYLSFVLAIVCMAPLVVGFYNYIVNVLRVLYLCNGTVDRIEQKLKAIEDVKRSEEEACRPPPPYLWACIQVTESDFLRLRDLAESIDIYQPSLRLVSAIYHILRGDAAVSRLLKVEKALSIHLDDWKKRSDFAMMTTYGGRLPSSSVAGTSAQVDIHAPSLSPPKVLESIPAVLSMVTPSRPAPRIEQRVQCPYADPESDLESSSGSEAGSTSGHESQVDTDVEHPHPLLMTLPRAKSFGNRKAPRRKRSIPMAPPGQNQVRDHRPYWTMYTPNTTAPPYPGDGSPRLYPIDLFQPPRLHTARRPPRPSVITEGLARERLGDSCEGEVTPTVPHDDTPTQIYDPMPINRTPTFPQHPTYYTPPIPPARIAKRSGC